MTRLLTLVGLAVVDSINPSALAITVALLLRGRSARPLVLAYLGGVLVTYFGIGLALALGLGAAPADAFESDAAYAVQGALGAALLAYAVLAPGRSAHRSVESRGLVAARGPAAVFALGAAVTLIELPTAVPYFGAVTALTRADLAVAEMVPLLALYNAIFIAPPFLLLVGQMALAERADGFFERLRGRFAAGAREALLWVFGIAGFFLLGDSLARLTNMG